MKPLTVIVTSCDRWDLLTQTLDSFFALNNHPPVAFHVHNDSINPVPDEIKIRYQGITWHEGTKRGLSAAWDYLVALVETEYFFNLEDDWLFEGNANFMSDAFKVVDECSQVWVRHEADHTHPLDDEIIINGVPVKATLRIGEWIGFSFNPALRRKSHWVETFPNGITGLDELELSRRTIFSYKALTLTNSSCRHIGGGRHVQNFKT